MSISRRSFLRQTAASLAGIAAAADVFRATHAAEGGAPLRIGMCDWNLGKTANVEAVALAATIGLDGVEVSLGYPADGLHVRKAEVQQAYLEAQVHHGIEFPSIALGVLNQVPLKSEPKAAIWLADCIEAARSLRAEVILIAFFGAGQLDMANDVEITRVVDVLKELAPRAEKAGVILGVENTLSAEDNIKILDRVGHPSVRVYYDLKNSANGGRDVPAEIRLLRDRICQVHLKNGRFLLSQKDNVDFPACAAALKEIGYKGWYILETSAPTDLIADTKANIEYVRQVF